MHSVALLLACTKPLLVVLCSMVAHMVASEPNLASDGNKPSVLSRANSTYQGCATKCLQGRQHPKQQPAQGWPSAMQQKWPSMCCTQLAASWYVLQNRPWSQQIHRKASLVGPEPSLLRRRTSHHPPHGPWQSQQPQGSLCTVCHGTGRTESTSR